METIKAKRVSVPCPELGQVRIPIFNEKMQITDWYSSPKLQIGVAWAKDEISHFVKLAGQPVKTLFNDQFYEFQKPINILINKNTIKQWEKLNRQFVPCTQN